MALQEQSPQEQSPQEQPPVEQSESVQISDGFTDFVVEYGARVTAGCIALLFFMGLFLFFRGGREAESAKAWSKFGQAKNAGEFATVADEYPDHPAGVWARLVEGEEYLSEGVRLQTTDGSRAEAALKKAEKAFELLDPLSDVPVEVQTRVELCRAWLQEATCDGKTAEVINAYQGFVDNHPESIYKDQIEERISALKAEGTQEFYAWFDNQNPKPSESAPQFPQDGLSGMPSGHPSMPVTLPRIPDALFPADWDELGDLDDLDELEADGAGAEGDSKPVSGKTGSDGDPADEGADESDKQAVPETDSPADTESK